MSCAAPRPSSQGQKKIARQDLGTVAFATCMDELLGLGFNYHAEEDSRTESVTLDQVPRSRRTLFRHGSFRHRRLASRQIAALAPLPVSLKCALVARLSFDNALGAYWLSTS